MQDRVCSMLIANRHHRLARPINHSSWCFPAMGTSAWSASVKQFILDGLFFFITVRNMYEHASRTTIAQSGLIHESEWTNGCNAGFGVLRLGRFCWLDVLFRSKFGIYCASQLVFMFATTFF